MALPNSNISTTLVGQTLGSGSRDVGTLCTHANINKWSRFKPYPYPNNVTGIYGTTGNDDHIIKNVINFGVNTAVVNAGSVPSTAGNYGLWGQWQAPTGGADEPYRLGDFRNYNHTATKAIDRIEFFNHNSGNRIVVKGTKTRNLPYTCKVYLNENADILLSEFLESSAGSLNNMYLTLVIGTNTSGLSFPEAYMIQSTKTVGQAIQDNSYTLEVSVNTANFVEDGILTAQPNIIYAYLAPQITNTNVFPTGVSFKMDQTITDILYNSTYAVYGDGSADGGTIPVYYITGTIYFALDHPTIPDGDYEYQETTGNSGNLIVSNVLIDITAGDPTATLRLRARIAEYNNQYVAISNSTFTGTVGQKHFDELIIPITGASGMLNVYIEAEVVNSSNNAINNLTPLRVNFNKTN